MDSISLLLSGLLFLLAVYLLLPRSQKTKRFEKLINNLGLLPRYPIIGSVAPVLFTPRNQLMDLMGYYFKVHGPIVSAWMGPFQVEVFTCLPEVAEAILSSPKHIQKGHTYEFLHPWLGTGLLTASGTKWHTRRKIITPTFHFTILENFIEIFSRNACILAKQLKKETRSESFNVFPYITKCTLDIICESAMGVTVNTQEGENPKYIAAIYEVSEQLIHRKFRPWLYPDLLFALSPSGRKCRECIGVLHDFTDKVIAERKTTRKQRGSLNTAPEDSDDIGKKTRKAFLDMLLDASESGVKLTNTDIREEVDTFMFEGHDTTTAAICWALYLLGSHQDIQGGREGLMALTLPEAKYDHSTLPAPTLIRLQPGISVCAEVCFVKIADQVCRVCERFICEELKTRNEKVYREQEEIFRGSDRPVTMRDLQEMKYLERVIKETLRLYPSVPVVERELREDVTVGDTTIPAGVDVALVIFYMHRNPLHFPNPEHFDPDNFLPERVSKRHPYAYVPFSAGPRNCIGQKFAMLEEKVILSTLIRNYRIHAIKERNGIKFTADLILRPDKGINISILPRVH